jgi:hypothetical protein
MCRANDRRTSPNIDRVRAHLTSMKRDAELDDKTRDEAITP